MTIVDTMELRTDYDAVIEECRRTGEPVYLAADGQVEAVVMDVVSFERREQILRAQEMVLASYADLLRGGETFASAEVESMMKRIIAGE